MKCMYCGSTQSKVIDSRMSDDGLSIRRRRECESCGRRFTTYERIEFVPVVVVKRDNTRESFDIAKVRRGIIKSCEKRMVTTEQIDNVVSNIEKRVISLNEKEISSDRIGDMVMDELKSLDQVAYVRFASVYRQFKDIQTFMDEISKMLTDDSTPNP